MNDSVQAQLQKILDECAGELNGVIDKTFNSVAKETKDEVAQNSPRDSGDYAGDWAIKRATKRGRGKLIGGVEVVIYNKKHYRLTHLLEKGHVVRNQFGTYERWTPDKKHIAPAEEHGERKLLAELQSKL